MIRRPSKEVLEKISNRCRMYIEMSRRKQQQRLATWRENEELFAAYIDADEKDGDGTSGYKQLYVPFSYAIAMTAHTYYTSVFMARNPIFQLMGRHGEGEMQVQALEALLDYQVQVGGMMVPLFLWLFDPIKYGHGFVGHYWDEERITCRKRVRRKKQFMGFELEGEEVVDEVEELVGYAGHRLFNIRPEDAFPDPRVSVWDFQRGMFFGRYVELSEEELLAGEHYFDVEELKKQAYGFGGRHSLSAVGDLPGENLDFHSGDTPGFVRAYEVYVKCIPREWGLAPSDKMEIWVITLTHADYRVFGIRPLGEYHGKFPIDVLELEPDAYNTFSRSMLEVIKPLNDAMTWLVNSHMFNVRAALNNQLVVDPSMVVMKDLENPEPGKLIRLKPTAYGRDVRTFITQLPVADVTRTHYSDMQVLVDLLQRVTGVNDNIMGLVNLGGRKTATEVRQSTSFGVNRLKTTCEYFSAMGFAPLAQKLVQGTQQHYDQVQKLRIVGDIAGLSPGFIEVSPESIAGFFDFVPVDGTLPVDRFAQANLWNMMLTQAMKIPQVAAQYDLGKIFGWVASIAGLKNIQQFKVKVAPPDVLVQQRQAGNIVPLDTLGRDFGRPPEQMQIPGLGATL